nr:MAG TPA: hypothetical protein [Caudoviricetes sp.]
MNADWKCKNLHKKCSERIGKNLIRNSNISSQWCQYVIATSQRKSVFYLQEKRSQFSKNFSEFQ